VDLTRKSFLFFVAAMTMQTGYAMPRKIQKPLPSAWLDEKITEA